MKAMYEMSRDPVMVKGLRSMPKDKLWITVTTAGEALPYGYWARSLSKLRSCGTKKETAGVLSIGSLTSFYA